MLKSVLLTVFCLLSLASAHNVLLPANGDRCFFETLKKGDELALSFQFGDRNAQSTVQQKGDFWITSPSGKIIKQHIDTSHGDHSVKATENGKHTYCFANKNPNVDTIDVSFNMHGVIFVDVNDPNADTLEAAVNRLTVLTSEVKNEQSYIVVRERTHRNTAESTNERVKWWSLFQLVVVAANSIFQIYYLKRFFEVKTVI